LFFFPDIDSQTCHKPTTALALSALCYSTSCPEPEAFDGWTVIQRRVDNSTDFYLGWQDYVYGFGDLCGNMWLGLEAIHELTKNDAELLVYLERWDGQSRYANYSHFQVGDAVSKYVLSISGYTGTAGDSMAFHNGMPFTTKDQDNDLNGVGNCAVVFHGAWWYKKCHKANLNGFYYNGHNSMSATGISWRFLKDNWYSHKYVEMKVRSQTV